MKNIVKLFLFFLLGVLVISTVVDLGCLEGGVMCAGFAPLLWPAGSDNMGGYKGRVLFIPESSVSAVPARPANAVDAIDAIKAVGAFEFITAGDKPIPIYATRATVSYKAEIHGDPDCRSYKKSGEFFHPGSKVEAAAFARQICNTPGYLVIEDEEKQILIGEEGYPCTVSAAFEGGKAPADKRGWTFTFEADSVAPLVVLDTPIDMAPLFANT